MAQKIFTSLVLFVLFFFTMSVSAISYEVEEAKQGNSSNQTVSLDNEVFDRDNYSRVYTHINFIDAFPTGNYVPDDYVPPGSTFTWRYYQDEVAHSAPPLGFLGAFSIRFIGEVGNCPTQWSDGTCGSIIRIFSSISRCLPEGKYRVEVLLDDSVLEERIFYPSRFTPFLEKVTIEGNPAIPEQRAISGHPFVEATPITSQVQIKGVVGPNNATCVTTNMNSMPNTIVKVSNTIKPDSGGHAHFTTDNEIGTGKYKVLKPGDVLNPGTNPEVTKDTVIEGEVDFETGIYSATYTPGEFGITEVITYEARREKTDRFPELRSFTALVEEVDIKVPELLPMSEGPSDLGQFYFVFSNTNCLHSPTARYVTSDMFLALAKLDQAYREKFGHRLSFNDASLEFGGTLDNANNEGRDAKCHLSHHRGIDIDINRIDEGGDNILTSEFSLEGVKYKKRLDFIRVIGRYNTNPWPELLPLNKTTSRHFRLTSE